jgi:hypothetical protein
VVCDSTPVQTTALRGLRRALSPTFPAGAMVFFIPWRMVAEESGAAHLDLLGPPGWCSGCWPHDGEVAGGAVADSTFRDRDACFLILGNSEMLPTRKCSSKMSRNTTLFPPESFSNPTSTSGL